MAATYSKTFFAPELFINNGVTDISFYKNAFGASEQIRFCNVDGSIHLAELSIGGAIFHIHKAESRGHGDVGAICSKSVQVPGRALLRRDDSLAKAFVLLW